MAPNMSAESSEAFDGLPVEGDGIDDQPAPQPTVLEAQPSPLSQVVTHNLHVIMTLDSNTTEDTIVSTPRRYINISKWANALRRRTSSTGSSGHNLYGRTGRRRCGQCRKWRQKVPLTCH
jgi:hypothetical protein